MNIYIHIVGYIYIYVSFVKINGMWTIMDVKSMCVMLIDLRCVASTLTCEFPQWGFRLNTHTNRTVSSLLLTKRKACQRWICNGALRHNFALVNFVWIAIQMHVYVIMCMCSFILMLICCAHLCLCWCCLVDVLVTIAVIAHVKTTTKCGFHDTH